MEPIEKTEKLDKVDLQILRTLQGNARLTIKELAQQVNLSSTPVFERLKRMESEDISKNTSPYSMPPNSTKLCGVLQRQDAAAEPRHRRRIHQDCARHTGSDRMLQYQRQLRLPAENHAPDMKYYQEFVLNVLGTVENLASVESVFVMDELKHEYGIHI